MSLQLYTVEFLAMYMAVIKAGKLLALINRSPYYLYNKVNKTFIKNINFIT